MDCLSLYYIRGPAMGNKISERRSQNIGRQEKKEKGSMIQLYDETFKEWEDGRIVIDKN